MKKIIAMLLAVAMLLCMVACDAEGGGKSSGKSKTKQEKFLDKLEDLVDQMVDAIEDDDEGTYGRLYDEFMETGEEFEEILEELEEKDPDAAEKFREDVYEVNTKLQDAINGDKEEGGVHLEPALPDEPIDGELTWEEKFGGETVTLTWCFPDARGIIDYGEWDRIQNAVNEITVREINTRIDIEVIPVGEYTEKMSLKYAADEPWDIAFSGTQWNSYPNAVSQEVLEPLNYDYMRTYMPETMDMLDQRYFDALTIKGKLYGVPLQNIYVRQNGIRFETNWADELGFKWEEVKDFEDLEPYFDLLLANGYTECFMGAGESMMENIISYMGFDALVGSNFPGVIRVTDEGCKVINQYESEEFKYIAGLMEKWHDAGYFTDDVMWNCQDNYNFTDVDRNPVGLEPVVKPGGDAMATMNLDNGVTVKTVPIGDPAVLTTSSIMQTTMVVSANTTHPGRALAFINLLNTNEELVNLLCHGQEGVDWAWIDRENKVIEPALGAYPGNEPFLVGNSFLTYHVHESQIGCWEETKKINSAAKASPLLGFTFDASPVRGKIAAIHGYIDAYLEPILCGMGEGGYEAALASMNKFLYDNGLQDILNEMQRQIDAWLASK